jgi:hypothetical protein
MQVMNLKSSNESCNYIDSKDNYETLPRPVIFLTLLVLGGIRRCIDTYITHSVGLNCSRSDNRMWSKL